jgi:hypothetical protein
MSHAIYSIFAFQFSDCSAFAPFLMSGAVTFDVDSGPTDNAKVPLRRERSAAILVSLFISEHFISGRRRKVWKRRSLT